MLFLSLFASHFVGQWSQIMALALAGPDSVTAGAPLRRRASFSTRCQFTQFTHFAVILEKLGCFAIFRLSFLKHFYIIRSIPVCRTGISFVTKIPFHVLSIMK